MDMAVKIERRSYFSDSEVSVLFEHLNWDSFLFVLDTAPLPPSGVLLLSHVPPLHDNRTSFTDVAKVSDGMGRSDNISGSILAFSTPC
jgi:hypothetical protein